MKVIYYADDGTEFDDEHECIKYEETQEAERLGMFSEIHILDYQFKEIKLGNGLTGYNLEDLLDRTMYVKFDSVKAAEYFDEQFEYYGFDTIGTYCPLGKGVYAFNDNANEWESVTNMITYYQGILDKFAERK